MQDFLCEDWSLDKDLAEISKNTIGVWPLLRGARIFITGGTGFIGCWLLESLQYSNKLFNLNIVAVVLTRNYDAFKKKAPHLAFDSNFQFVEGEVHNFTFPEGEFTHIIHAATEASAELNEKNPLQMFSTVVSGTIRVFDFAVLKKVERILYLSSGAVYGQQPSTLEHVGEDYLGGPSPVDVKATYAEAKRAAEMLCAIYAKQFNLQISIARIFALLGPYLSLDIHFAAGNFIRDAILGKKIIINGNGLPVRSYLYAADLTTCLWHMLVRAPAGKPYNVGSDEGVAIKDLAGRIAKILGSHDIEVMGKDDGGWNIGRYVPSVNLIKQDLGIEMTTSLDQAILRTALWHGWKGKK